MPQTRAAPRGPDESRRVAGGCGPPTMSCNLLAETLDDPGPVAAGGVAQAWLLLTDGTGPLYNPYNRVNLRTGAARAVRELRPWPA